MIYTLFLISFKADKIEIINVEGKRITRLLKNVIIKGKEFKVFSQFALFNPEDNIFYAADSLYISARNAEITGDSMNMQIKEKITRIYGKVQLNIDETRILTKNLLFYHKDDLAFFPDSFSLIYPKKGIRVLGRNMRFDVARNIGRVIERPLLLKGDSLQMLSDTVYLNHPEKCIKGTGNVEIKSKEFVITLDSISYCYEKEKGKGFNVLIKGSEEKVKGDSAVFLIKEEKIKKAEIMSNVQAWHRAEEFSVKVSSPCLFMHFKDNKPIKLIFTGGVLGVYHEYK